MITSARVRIAAATMTLPLLTAGCASKKEEPPPYDPGDSKATSAEKQPWDEKSPAGAKAFVRHYIDVFNKAQTSLDTTEMRSLSTKSCATCKSWAGYIDKVKNKGGRFKNYDHKIEELTELKEQKRFAVRLASDKALTWPSANAKPRTTKPQTFMTIALLRWTENGWKMARIFEVS